jgi:hypothetical protein
LKRASTDSFIGWRMKRVQFRIWTVSAILPARHEP